MVLKIYSRYHLNSLLNSTRSGPILFSAVALSGLVTAILGVETKMHCDTELECAQSTVLLRIPLLGHIIYTSIYYTA